MVNQKTSALQVEIEALKARAERLEAVNRIALRLGTTLDFETFLDQLIASIIDYVGCDRVLVLVSDNQDTNLEYGASNFRLASPERQQQLETMRLSLYKPEDGALVSGWQEGKSLAVGSGDDKQHSSATWLAEVLACESLWSSPLVLEEQLIGVIVIDNSQGGKPISEAQQESLTALGDSVAMVLQNARLHRRTVLELADNMREMYILRQIDRELSDTIDLKHVFEMTLDWVLRFTSAQSASLALYNEDSDQLHFLVEYGYDIPSEQLALIRREYGGGISHRVARSGHAEVVPDVSMDKDFVRVSSNTRSQLCVPVMREDRVVAAITLESRRLNGFSEQHLDFVQKLATRAGVAIDNARLYEEAVYEREKLSHILNNTADIVIVVGLDERIALINQSAISALHLYPKETYAGNLVSESLEDTALLEAFVKAKGVGSQYTAEVKLPNERIFHVNIRRFEGIGWIIVMHDITPFKEMDRLKSELIATVSHDLKQPLAVMNGYIELMLMQQAVAPQGMNSVQMIRKAVQNMRQLIDDLLDLAKIESGIKLDLVPVDLTSVLNDCIDQLKPVAQGKAMTITNTVGESAPIVMGDRSRLRQILINLIGNAVKYTQPEGWVKVWAEQRGNILKLSIQDNGMGISPEDQIHIFDRFYRVRRPETDSIEGTGLGLAIVKSLVEAHNGQIGLESRLGEGTTFYFTLPVEDGALN